MRGFSGAPVLSRPEGLVISVFSSWLDGCHQRKQTGQADASLGWTGCLIVISAPGRNEE